MESNPLENSSEQIETPTISVVQEQPAEQTNWSAPTAQLPTQTTTAGEVSPIVWLIIGIVLIGLLGVGGFWGYSRLIPNTKNSKQTNNETTGTKPQENKVNDFTIDLEKQSTALLTEKTVYFKESYGDNENIYFTVPMPTNAKATGDATENADPNNPNYLRLIYSGSIPISVFDKTDKAVGQGRMYVYANPTSTTTNEFPSVKELTDKELKNSTSWKNIERIDNQTFCASTGTELIPEWSCKTYVLGNTKNSISGTEQTFIWYSFKLEIEKSVNLDFVKNESKKFYNNYLKGKIIKK